MSKIHQPNKQLALQIHELLDTPSLRSGTKILRAVLQSISGALQRGEQVRIRGFGTFKLVERTHRPTPNNVLTNDKNGPILAAGLKKYKPRRVIVFEPSLPLMAMLNMNSPNYEERRALRRWHACE